MYVLQVVLKVEAVAHIHIETSFERSSPIHRVTMSHTPHLCASLFIYILIWICTVCA